MIGEKDCGLVDWEAVTGIDVEAGGCLGPEQKGFDKEKCIGCEFYPKEAKHE